MNFIDKMKAEIITGAESGFYGNERELTDMEIIESLDESSKAFNEVAYMQATDNYHNLQIINEIEAAEKEIAAGGEAAVEGLKQKGYAVKKYANRGADKIVTLLKGLLGWFTGSGADFKKLSVEAKNLNKRLEKVIMKADDDDNKIEVKKVDIAIISKLADRATGGKGRSIRDTKSSVDGMSKIDAIGRSVLKHLPSLASKDEAPMVTLSNTVKEFSDNLKKFTESNDEVEKNKDLLSSLSDWTTEELSPAGALTATKERLKSISDEFNYNNKVVTDIKALIKAVEKKNTTIDPKVSTAIDSQAIITNIVSTVLIWRKTALTTAKWAKKELNGVITFGYKLESMGKKA